MPVGWQPDEEDWASQGWRQRPAVADTTQFQLPRFRGTYLRPVTEPESRWWHPFTWYHAVRMWRLRRRFRRAARRDRATWAA